MFVKLNAADEVVEAADSETALTGCESGEYVVEIRDSRQVVVGEVLPPPAELDGQTSIFDEFEAA